MLDCETLTVAMSEEEKKKEIKAIRKELAALQQPMKQAKTPVIVLFEGWSAAGKGQMIAKLISELDPRYYQVYSYPAPTAEERRKPFLWPFWNNIPPYGEMAVLERSWYKRAIEDSKCGLADIDDAMKSINIFERQLKDDGYTIIKFFLYIDAEEQKRRLHELAKSKATSWRVDESDWERNRRHSELTEELEPVLRGTDTAWAPWHIVLNDNKTDGTLLVLRTVRDGIKAALANPRAGSGATIERKWPLLSMPLLSEVDLTPSISEEEYDAELKRERKKLQKLHSMLYREKIPVVLGFEGWDAAGKGGAIRRLSWALDPRGFDVIPISAPTPDALNRHYLWRFWREIPKDGHVALFDRTWYGRVMVEQIENLTPAERTSAAYDEINEFEYELYRWGAIVMKFWIQIDKDTQLARFEARQNTPEKQYKITDEDWRNREKWPQYEKAVNEMLQRTSTKYAPWFVIPGNDKRYARLQVLKIMRKQLEKRLG